MLKVLRRHVGNRRAAGQAFTHGGAGRGDHRKEPADDGRQVPAANGRPGLKGVVLEGFDDAGARRFRDPRCRPVTLRVRHDHLTRGRLPNQAFEPHTDQGGEIAARDLGRRQREAKFPRETRLARTLGSGRDSTGQVQTGVDGGCLPVRVLGPGRISACVEQLSRLDQRGRVGRIEVHGAPQMLESPVGIARAPFELSELAVEERAFRRDRECPLVGTPCILDASLPGGGLRGVDHVLHVAEPQDFDAPAQVGQRGIERQRSSRTSPAPARSCPTPAAPGLYRRARARTCPQLRVQRRRL